MKKRTALVMAGGTGGHIFPGLAVAEALRERGWTVHWLGAPGTPERPSMERQWVPPRGFAFEPIDFYGVRGKGGLTVLLLPLRLLRAFWQSLQIVRRVRPDVLVGMGGYVSFPGAMMGVLWGCPLVLHEQNAVAGMANRVLAALADRIYTAFPQVLAQPKAQAQASWVGNPLRPAFLNQAAPKERMAGRSGPLRLLVVGGSLGARALNDVVPQALALLPPAQRPQVIHQSGASQIDALRRNYEQAGVQAELTPFIDDTASAFAHADLVICRAGASTVTELAAVGVAALFVPLPTAVDDHQTHNARFLTEAGAGELMPQSQLTPAALAQRLASLERTTLLAWAEAAHRSRQIGATPAIVAACEELSA